MSDEQPEHHHQPEYEIQIDRVHYAVHQHIMTGTELRQVPKAPIGPDRDLFEVIPGHKDKKIEDTEPVEIHNGLRFFTAPATINPGSTDIRRTDA